MFVLGWSRYGNCRVVASCVACSQIRMGLVTVHSLQLVLDRLRDVIWHLVDHRHAGRIFLDLGDGLLPVGTQKIRWPSPCRPDRKPLVEPESDLLTEQITRFGIFARGGWHKIFPLGIDSPEFGGRRSSVDAL
jgi:hypothetical protein